MSRFYTLDDNETPNGLTDEALKRVKAEALAMTNAEGLALYEAMFMFKHKASGLPEEMHVAVDNLFNRLTKALLEVTNAE